MYDVRFSMYDLQIMRSGAAGGEQATRMRCPAGADWQWDASKPTCDVQRWQTESAHVRGAIFDVRFIHNVRVAQIFSDH